MRRTLLILASVAATLVITSAAARAGTYRVYGGCNGNFTSETNNASRIALYTQCPGLMARNVVGNFTTPNGAFGRWVFDTPPATSIVGFDLGGSMYESELGWEVSVFQAGGNVPGGYGNLAVCPGCPGHQVEFGPTAGVANATQVGIRVRCIRSAGCTNQTTEAVINTSELAVDISDATAPAVAGIDGGLWHDGGWQRGTKRVAFLGNDVHVGIRQAYAQADPGPGSKEFNVVNAACDYSRKRPCPTDLISDGLVDTELIGNGVHTLRVVAVDTANNAGYQDRTIQIDNTPPKPPEIVSFEGDGVWSSDPSRMVTWTLPAQQQHAPIDAGIEHTCFQLPGGGEQCRDHVNPGPDGYGGIGPWRGPGIYRIRWYLRDAAGNSDPDAMSREVELKYDDVAPGRAEPLGTSSWIDANEARSYLLPVRMTAGATLPVSGIAGFSVTVDGSQPDADLDDPQDVRGSTGDVRLSDLPEGATTVKARAISGAGVPAPPEAVGERVLRVDKTAPQLEIDAAAPEEWRREAVRLRVAATDQAALSGMTAAPAEEPVEEGGYLTYRIDGGEPHRLRGGSGAIEVSEDGKHTVVVTATDVAGNDSDDVTRVFRIDTTSPSPLGFVAQDPNDPRTITAIAADPTSGVASGTIEARSRAGGSWKKLDTSMADGRLSTTVDEDALPRGEYLFRVTARDAAGNTGSSDQFAQGPQAGRQLVLAVPIRVDTVLQLSIDRPKATRRVCSRRAPGKRRVRRRSCRIVVVRQNPAKPPVVRFGESIALHGLLTDGAGHALRNTLVDGGYRGLAPSLQLDGKIAVRTDAQGRFDFTSPAGPSRDVVFRFGGDSVRRPAEGSQRVLVRAGATLRPSSRIVLNGQRVVFTGGLKAGPVPPGGVVVNLQAKIPGGWRTFKTIRTNGLGRFRSIYGFQRTSGRPTYEFRVQVRRESGYPYELGYSRVARVTVIGR